MTRPADEIEKSRLIEGPFELKPIDFRANAETCIRFRADSFIRSFGNAQAFWGEDNKGADRYLQWLRGKSEEIAGSCAHLWDCSGIIGQIELGLARAPTNAGHIYLIYLVPEYRQRGLGTQLLQYAEALFRAWGASEGSLRVSPSNTAALALYKKNGWSQTSIEPDTDHLLVMTKQF